MNEEHFDNHTESREAEGSAISSIQKLSTSDWIKLATAVGFVLLAWARVEAGLESINRRLDSIESAQQQFVRSDVSQARNETLGAKLDAVNLRLERIESKIDFSDRR